jgi:hypothetical protein
MGRVSSSYLIAMTLLGATLAAPVASAGHRTPETVAQQRARFRARIGAGWYTPYDGQIARRLGERPVSPRTTPRQK